MKIFSPAFLVAKELVRTAALDLDGEEADLSWGQLTDISDFLQEIAARAVPFWPPQSKLNSLWGVGPSLEKPSKPPTSPSDPIGPDRRAAAAARA